MPATAPTGIEIGAAAVILVLVVLLVLFLVRRSRNVYGKLWAPLIPLVNGTAQGSRLSGTYDGMPVLARIAGDDGENPTFHYELTLTPGMAAKDWSLSYTGEKFLGTGTKTWRVKSKDDDLRKRLTDAGVVTAIQNWSSEPEITYKGKSGTLHYWKRAEGMYDIPAPHEFQTQLELLSRLAKLNREQNTELGFSPQSPTGQGLRQKT